MGARRIRRELFRKDQAQSRLVNGVLKDKERCRRAARMKQLIRTGKPPYTPAVRSWLSAELGKPAKQVTEDDVKALLKD